MIKIKLLNNNLEDIDYNFSDFEIMASRCLLSKYPNMSAVNHWHDDFEFTIILKGKMFYSINGKSYELKEGQAIFVNSQHMHYGYSLDKSECEFICILIPKSLLSSIPRITNLYVNPIYTDASHPYFIFNSSIDWQRNFIDKLTEIYELCTNADEGFELHVMSILYSICFTLYKNVVNDNSSEEGTFNKSLDLMHSMVGYIQNNYHTKITLKDIASAGNICRSRCCEIFNEFLHKSPIYYLTEYRINKSLELLNNSSYSITEIAMQCGFNSSSYFTETFQKHIGCTPTQYRKKLTE